VLPRATPSAEKRPEVATLLDRYQAFILDMDGVLYLLDQEIPGSTGAVRAMREAGKRLVFLTNNSALTPEMYVERLQRQGIEAEAGEIVTSARACRSYLESNFETRGKKALVIGEAGLLDECALMGIEVVSPDEWKNADFLLVGWDRHFDFHKLKAAVLAARNGAVYVAMNTDSTYPTPQGLWPGAGTMVAAVTTGAGREPTVVGKPNPLIVDLALWRMRAGKDETLMVGDRLDTDIKVGATAGIDTLLVLSGVSRESDIPGSGVRPTHVRKDLAGLLE
jgi:4-nitrophenyl phosphatase